MPNDWKTAPELMLAITTYRKAVHTLVRENRSHGATNAGELIAHIYNFAGADDSTADTHGRNMIRAVADILESLEAIDQQLGHAKAILKAAVDFMDDAETKRRHAASTYRV